MAYLNGWSRQLAIDYDNATFHSVSSYTVGFVTILLGVRAVVTSLTQSVIVFEVKMVFAPSGLAVIATAMTIISRV